MNRHNRLLSPSRRRDDEGEPGGSYDRSLRHFFKNHGRSERSSPKDSRHRGIKYVNPSTVITADSLCED
jgi:hypothetical protein